MSRMKMGGKRTRWEFGETGINVQKYAGIRREAERKKHQNDTVAAEGLKIEEDNYDWP